MPYQIANPDLSNNPAYLEPRISNLEGQLNNYKENDKASQLLQHGANIVNANVSSPLSVEVQGRTLMNLLGQSTFDTSKYYLFSPNKNTTKITVNGTKSETVTKIDGSTLAGGSVTTNFVGKVTASFVENPNYGRRTWSSSTLTTLMLPTGNGADYGEVEQARYDDWKVLNDGKRGGTSTSAVGSIAQNQFSFDIVKALEIAFGTEIWQGKTLLADKIAIAKQNISSYSFNWHGYGTSVGGNKASIQRWAANSSAWFGVTSHTSGTVTKLNTGTSNLNEIDSNGFVHCIAYAEPADSVTMSAIYTDYVELVIVTSYIKPVKYTIKQDFQRKVAGSTVENGHDFKQGQGQTSLLAPNGSWAAPTQTSFDRLKTLDGQTSTAGGTSTSGGIAQQSFSFDIIRALQDKYGNQIWQGKTLLADKVAIVKSIVTTLTGNWHGFGSSPTGNKSYFAWWYPSSSKWADDGGRISHTNGTVTKQTLSSSAISALVDSNGIVNFIVYTDASDGTTASTITTDYIELEFTVNSNLPILEDSLYEVTKAHYDLINIDPAWSGQSLVDKYPYVQGVQHLNPAVAVDGENLVPPLSEWTALNSISTIESPYKLRYNPTGTFQESMVEIPVLPNTVYTAGIKTSHADLRGIITFLDASKQAVGVATASFTTSLTTTTPANTKYIRYRLSNWTVVNGTIEDIYLMLGSAAKPFTPRNSSYLITNTTLTGVQGTGDVLYKDGESWKVLRKWERDVIFDNSKFTIMPTGTPTGFKVFYNQSSSQFPSIPIANSSSVIVTKHNGQILQSKVYSGTNLVERADMAYLSTTPVLVLSVSNLDTGFSDAYTPAADEISAYFNGWQVKTADGTGKPTAWKSIVDGTDAPTQTLTYVKSNKAANYTPYKITYQLATPRVENVQAEGDLVVDGNTQVTVDSGIVIREKVTPTLNSGIYHINAAAVTASILKNKALKIINVYKNGIVDSKAKIIGNTSIAYGLSRVEILQADFDPTAEYTVTYMILEKEKFTTNAIDLKVLYNQSVRSTIDDIIAKQSDNSSIISIHDSAIFEMYKRLKALGG